MDEGLTDESEITIVSIGLESSITGIAFAELLVVSGGELACVAAGNTFGHGGETLAGVFPNRLTERAANVRFENNGL